jgi:hypothetical protein
VESPSPIPEPFKILRCVSCHVDSHQQAAQAFSRQLRQGREDDLPSPPGENLQRFSRTSRALPTAIGSAKLKTNIAR